MPHLQVRPRPEQIAPRLWRVGGGSWDGTVDAASAEEDANAYVLQGGGAAALIDCASLAGRARIEANLRATGVDPTGLGELLLTHSHWDHTEAAHQWQSSYGLRTHLNAVGAEYINRGDQRLIGAPLHGPDYAFEPFVVDHPVRDGESFELSGIAVTAHFLPGHTLDSTLYTFELADFRVGVCGDIAFGPDERGSYRIGLMSNLWGSNLDQYLDSLHRLAQIPIDLLVPGHGGPVTGRANVAETVSGALATVEALAANDAVRRNLGI